MPSLSRRTLLEIRAVLDAVASAGVGVMEVRAAKAHVGAIDAALKPKRSVAPARKRRESKKKSHRDEMGAIRVAVLTRAGGLCEQCGTAQERLECDHFYGGSRRRSEQAVETVWALCHYCHRSKTRNEPSASFWLERFINHSATYGYPTGPALKRLESLHIQGRAG